MSLRRAIALGEKKLYTARLAILRRWHKFDFMKLIILDAHALIHRAYHALPPLSTQRGEPTNAIYGFFSVFIKMTQDLKPDYLVAAFDTPAPTFRKKMFEAYKAHRPKTPDELVAQLKKIKELMPQFGILALSKEGYEADDIIGTVVKLLTTHYSLPTAPLEIIIVTGDLDTLQLVREGVKVYTMRKGISDVVIYDEKAVRDRFGLAPSQMPDYKGLVGDASDNIPGIPGVGPKTATTLLQKFENLETVFASKDIPEKIREKKDQALFSKELATINTASLIQFELEKAKWSGFNIKVTEQIFSQLGFSSLTRRIKEPLEHSEKQSSLFSEEKTEEPKDADYPLAQIASWLLDPEIKDPRPTQSLNLLKISLEQKGLKEVFQNIEVPLVPVLEKMQSIGILVDKKTLEELSEDLQKELKMIRQEIARIAGGELNPSSPDQLRSLLFETLKLSPTGVKKTPKGKISTKESELVKIAHKHEIIPILLHHREIEKLLTTYIQPLFKKIGEDGRVHTSFIQTGTATGRLSSQNPNLQNIPVKGEWAKRVKNMFVAQKEYTLASFDYSQVELRVAAHLAGDENLIKAFRNGEDIHTHTASQVFNMPEDAVTPQMRRTAKVFNFGILYGLSARGLSESLRISYEEAKDFIDTYFARFSGIKTYIEKTREEVVKKGYVQTILGRKRFFPELKNPERLGHNIREALFREAVNFTVQGSATADIIKLAMIQCAEAFSARSDEVRLLLQIHDDLLFEIKKEKIDEAIPQIKKIMEGVMKLSVPLLVEINTGETWGEMRKLKTVIPK